MFASNLDTLKEKNKYLELLKNDKDAIEHGKPCDQTIFLNIPFFLTYLPIGILGGAKEKYPFEV